MLPSLIALPILGLLVVFQSAVVSRLPLLHGTADIVLLVVIAWALQDRVRSAWQWSILGGLFVGFVSALHFSIPVLSYMMITGLVLIVKRRVWQVPILAMFAMTFVGTLFNLTLSALAVSLGGATLPLLDTLRLIILPSLILNLLLAAPIYAMVRDLAEWVYPEEIKI
ncbi:MAG: hypothetical protein KKD28_14735 [Chloroflexi bacterium]|nr:hypothetical protein [Chloroflexota bacterium]